MVWRQTDRQTDRGLNYYGLEKETLSWFGERERKFNYQCWERERERERERGRERERESLSNIWFNKFCCIY